MDQALYDLAEILVCDPVAAHRAATRSALYALGCRHIEIVASLNDFLDALDNRPPDLAICEAQVGLAGLCGAIRKLRRGESYNPFVAIIVTAWTTSSAQVADVINCGADGFLLRPFSAGILDQRVRAHLSNQKPFIVTGGYVGPERRNPDTRASTAFSFVPPNLLKMKLEARPQVDEAIRLFNVELHNARAKLMKELGRRAAVCLEN